MLVFLVFAILLSFTQAQPYSQITWYNTSQTLRPPPSRIYSACTNDPTWNGLVNAFFLGGYDPDNQLYYDDFWTDQVPDPTIPKFVGPVFPYFPGGNRSGAVMFKGMFPQFQYLAGGWVAPNNCSAGKYNDSWIYIDTVGWFQLSPDIWPNIGNDGASSAYIYNNVTNGINAVIVPGYYCGDVLGRGLPILISSAPGYINGSSFPLVQWNTTTSSPWLGRLQYCYYTGVVILPWYTDDRTILIAGGIRGDQKTLSNQVSTSYNRVKSWFTYAAPWAPRYQLGLTMGYDNNYLFMSGGITTTGVAYDTWYQSDTTKQVWKMLNPIGSDLPAWYATCTFYFAPNILIQYNGRANYNNGTDIPSGYVYGIMQ